MPRDSAPPPSGEFDIVLTKPFEGSPTHTVEVIGEPNRSASVRISNYTGKDKINEKEGDVPADDVNELLSLTNQVRGYPSHPSKDIYGFDTKLEFNTFEIQWSNVEEDALSSEISELADETKDSFKRIVDSIEALSRTFAKKDAAI